MPIKATVISDDKMSEAEFDATAWFEQAADAEIVSLAEEGWGHEETSDAIAEFYRRRLPAVRKVFDHVAGLLKVDPKCAYAGLGCEIDAEAATLWVRKKRLNLFPILIAIEDGEYEPK